MSSGFNPNMFKEANEACKEFTIIPDGFYVAKLISACICRAKSSNRLQASFTWRITEEDEEFAGKLIFDHIGLEKNGEPFDKGYQILAIRSNQLQIPSTEISNMQEMNIFLERAINTTARIELYTNRNEKGEFQNLRISGNQLIYSPFDDEEMPSSEITEVDNFPPFENTPQVNNLELPNAPSAPSVPEEIEEIPSPMEENTLQLEEGMTVQGMFGEQAITGTIYKIEEDFVKIQVGNKAYPCSKNSIQLIT